MFEIMNQMRTPGSEVLYNIPSEEEFKDMRQDVMDEYFQHLAKYGVTERLMVAKGETYGHKSARILSLAQTGYL